jgi:hypothetical protein
MNCGSGRPQSTSTTLACASACQGNSGPDDASSKPPGPPKASCWSCAWLNMMNVQKAEDPHIAFRSQGPPGKNRIYRLQLPGCPWPAVPKDEMTHHGNRMTHHGNRWRRRHQAFSLPWGFAGRRAEIIPKLFVRGGRNRSQALRLRTPPPQGQGPRQPSPPAEIALCRRHKRQPPRPKSRPAGAISVGCVAGTAERRFGQSSPRPDWLRLTAQDRVPGRHGDALQQVLDYSKELCRPLTCGEKGPTDVPLCHVCFGQDAPASVHGQL